MTNYIELTSSRRNRNQYPNPAFFTTTINDTGMRDKTTALDPVSNAYPIKSWNTSMGIPTTTEYVNFPVDIKYILGQYVLIVGNDFNQSYNFYKNCVFAFANITQSTEFKEKIIESRFVGFEGGDELLLVKLERSNVIFIEVGDVYGLAIYDYYTGVDTSTDEFPRIRIPNSSNINNFYTNYQISRNTDNNPIDTSDGTYGTITLFAPTASPSYNNENTPYVNILNLSRERITSYDLLGVNNDKIQVFLQHDLQSIENWFVKLYDSITYSSPYDRVLKVKTFKKVVINNYSLISDVLTTTTELEVNDLISFTDNTDVLNTFIITSKNGNTYTLNTAPIDTNINISAYVNNVILYESLNFSEINFSRPTILLLYPFSYDNYSPLNYNGFNYGSSDCFEISLLNLIVPNKPLLNGGTVIKYPYLYVKLVSSTSSPTVLYSNNPKVSNTTFRVVITDTNPDSLFIKLWDDGMFHSIKFRPNETLTFSLHYPNMELLEFEESDYFSPSSVNPELQISALFLIRKK